MKKILKKVMVFAMCAIMVGSQPVLAQTSTAAETATRETVGKTVKVGDANVMIMFRVLPSSIELQVLSLNNVALKEIDMNVDYGLVVHSRGSYTSIRKSERLVGEDLKTLAITKKPADEFSELDPYHQGFCYEKECIATITLTAQDGTTETVTLNVTLPSPW